MSPEDIQALLGGVLDDEHHHSHAATSELTPGAPTDPSSDPKALARSERKRSREKQRRSDVNRQFAELTTVLRKIETEQAEEFGHEQLPSLSPSNRVDLIARTILLLNSLNKAVKRRKTECEQLTNDLEQAKRAGEETACKLKEQMMAPQSMGQNRVMMMVPMMIGGDQPMPMMQCMPQQASFPATDNNSQSNTSAANAMPWIQMPPQTMPQAWMMPTTEQASAPTNTTQKKKAPPKEVGGNLAHCA